MQKAAANYPCTLSGRLEVFTAVDIVTLINNTRKSGQLEAIQTGVQKSIFFQDGEIVFAKSNLKEDRLGESLLRAGRITAQHLEAAGKLLGPDAKLGKVLVDQGFLAPAKLWIGVKNQIEEIFYTVLKMSQGTFQFFYGPPKLDNVVRLSKSVGTMILEGVREIDELKIFIEQIINRQTVFLPLNRPPDLILTEIEREILQLIDGQRSVRQILVDTSTSPFVTFKVLSNLMLARIVVPKDLIAGGAADPAHLNFGQFESAAQAVSKADLQAEPAEDLAGLLDHYEKFFSEISRTVQDYGYSLRSDFAEYVLDTESPYHAWVEGLEWDDERGIEAGALMSKFQKMPAGQRLAQLRRLLEDILFYVLFKIQNKLPSDVSALLIQSIEELNLTPVGGPV